MYVQTGVCGAGRRTFSAGAGTGSGFLRAPRESNPGCVVGCGSLGSDAGAATGAAGARGAAPGGAMAGAGTSTLRAPVLRSTLAVSARPESASAVAAGAPGCEARWKATPSGPRGAGTPKIVLVALGLGVAATDAAIGAGVVARGVTGAATTGAGVVVRGG